jgi:hypothetical protein
MNDFDNDFDKFVSEVKPGDTWLSVQRDWSNRKIVSKIEVARKTKNQIIVQVGGFEKRYRISDGGQVGETWSGMVFPLPSSDKEIEEVRAENRISKLRGSIRILVGSHRLDELSEQSLKQIMDLLEGQTGSESGDHDS